MAEIWTDAVNIGTSTNYQQRYKITYTSGATTTSATQVITVQPQVRKTDASYRRDLHTWRVNINVAGIELVNNDIRSMPTQYISAGHIYMVKDTWYDWGQSYSVTLNNTGAAITVIGIMRCVDTVPWGANTAAVKTITLPRYQIVPGTPQNTTSFFNTNTRVITYSWSSGGDTAYYRVWSNHFNEAGNLIKQGWVGDNLTTTNVSENVSDQVTRITWEVTAHSSTEDTSSTGEQQVTVDAYHKIYIKVNNTWKKAIPWVKVGNTWKKCSKAYVKVGDTWKLTKV